MPGPNVHIHITPPEEPHFPPAQILEHLTCGVPLPRGISRESVWRLANDHGEDVPVQTSILGRWPDGSPKWMLLEFPAPRVAESRTYALSASSTQTTKPAALGITSGQSVELKSGALVIRAAPGCSVPLLRDDAEVAAIAVDAIASDGTRHIAQFEAACIEYNGPLRATARLHGRLPLPGGLLKIDLRLSVFSATPIIKCDVTLHNPRRAEHPGNCWELGDSGSVLFKGVRVVLAPTNSQAHIAYSEAPVHWQSTSDHVSIYQESSGGESWKSRVHVDRSGAVPMTHPGYIVWTSGASHEGRRTQPAVQTSTAETTWAATLLNFWQEFPSEITGDVSGTLVVEPFPQRFPSLHELQGGERKTRTCVFAYGDTEIARSAIESASNPSFAYASADWVCATGVVPFLDAPQDPRHEQLLAMALNGPTSFEAKRERIDEYGWRNFGDLFADHESAFSASGELVSHYNNQYDAIFGFGFQFLRTGDRRWWRLMNDLARHVADVDIYHTTEDKAAYNGGLFWHTYHYVDAGKSSHRSYPRSQGIAGGGPSAEHNYNAGLALHYLLTGWIPSRDAAVGLGRWVIDMEDGSRTPFRWLSRSRTGWASASGGLLYHGPGRAGGNSINALIVAFELTDDPLYLREAEGLIRRCIHPSDDIKSLNLLDAERRWFYTVFLEAIGRYVWLKQGRGELDGMYSYAREALLHYARWMRENEYPYLEKPEILEFPTETWSAQDIRKSDLLAWAALCEGSSEREAFLVSSKRFFEDVLTRLPRLPTFSYTRPMVLMLARGYVYPWTVAHDDIRLVPAITDQDHPRQPRFEPQRIVAVRRAKTVAFLLATATLGLVIAALL